uniref:ATPase Na+/K+ transporting subunit beta 3 n=1 Tax=Canis lupus familiaris TaxID=9615 RepID=A0A8C0M4V4_CANLF
DDISFHRPAAPGSIPEKGQVRTLVRAAGGGLHGAPQPPGPVTEPGAGAGRGGGPGTACSSPLLRRDGSGRRSGFRVLPAGWPTASPDSSSSSPSASRGTCGSGTPTFGLSSYISVLSPRHFFFFLKLPCAVSASRDQGTGTPGGTPRAAPPRAAPPRAAPPRPSPEPGGGAGREARGGGAAARGAGPRRGGRSFLAETGRAGRRAGGSGGGDGGAGRAARGLAAARGDVRLPRPERPPGSRGAVGSSAHRSEEVSSAVRLPPPEPGRASALLAAAAAAASASAPAAAAPLAVRAHTMTKKEKKSFNQSLAEWKLFIYNPTTGEFLGRTAKSWGSLYVVGK